MTEQEYQFKILTGISVKQCRDFYAAFGRFPNADESQFIHKHSDMALAILVNKCAPSQDDILRSMQNE